MSDGPCPDPYPHPGHQWPSADGKIYTCPGIPQPPPPPQPQPGKK